MKKLLMSALLVLSTCLSAPMASMAAEGGPALFSSVKAWEMTPSNPY